MYRLTWLEEADTKLIGILIDTNFRPDVVSALHRLERELTDSPLNVGHARSSSLHRMAARGPLLFEFEIIGDDLRVLVHDCSLLPSFD